MANDLRDRGVTILGTSAEMVDAAEDREKFEDIMEKLDITRPKGRAVWDNEAGTRIAEEVPAPVLVRPE